MIGSVPSRAAQECETDFSPQREQPSGLLLRQTNRTNAEPDKKMAFPSQKVRPTRAGQVLFSVERFSLTLTISDVDLNLCVAFCVTLLRIEKYIF